MSNFKTDFLNFYHTDLHTSIADMISSTYDDVKYCESEARFLYESELAIQRLKKVSEFDVTQVIDECNSNKYSPVVFIDSIGSEVLKSEVE